MRGGASELPRVAAALRRRGEEPRLLDPTRFPARQLLALDASAPELSGVTAVWQSIVVALELPAMDAEAHATCVAASELALAGFLDSLGVFQLDAHWKQQRADNKVFQLAAARRLGLDVPATLVANSADAVRRFARELDDRSIVMKMLVQPIGDEHAPTVFTTVLDDVHGDGALAGLELCPMIFQERIANRFDVRAIVVGEHIFAAATPAAASGEVDWRRATIESDTTPEWRPYTLPARTADGILALTRELELGFAAVDLIATPDERHVFLELNATGSFGFLGDAIAEPVADAIAELLVSRG